MKFTMKSILAAGLVAAMSAGAVDATYPCPDGAGDGAQGRWAIQKGGAFWLGVYKTPAGQTGASLLWGGGSPNPQYDVKLDGKTATMKQNCGKDRVRVTTVKADGEKAEITFQMTNKQGVPQGKPEVCKAKRIPPVGPAPDPAKAKLGQPVDLLAGGIDGWEAMNPKAYFGWSLKDGVLSNRIRRRPNGKPYGGDSNIVTKRRDFFDFKLSYDVRVLPHCNSGVYLRGIYELQVLDSYGQKLDRHNMAALYGRVTPACAAEKPANEWQHVDATLYKRHLTVVLNGKKIIDNEPVLGCTGGALTSDEFVPGPLYLQGDHSDADFRNMILTPIEK